MGLFSGSETRGRVSGLFKLASQSLAKPVALFGEGFGLCLVVSLECVLEGLLSPTPGLFFEPPTFVWRLVYVLAWEIKGIHKRVLLCI